MRTGTFIVLLRSGYFSKTFILYIPRDLTSCFSRARVHCDNKPSRTGLNPAQWRHMATEIWVNIGSGNGLLPDGTKPLPEPMLINSEVNWHIRAISQEMHQPSITKIRLKITYIKFNSNFPGAYELNMIRPIPPYIDTKATLYWQLLMKGTSRIP